MKARTETVYLNEGVESSLIAEKEARIRKFRTEASRKASMANKRIERLERAGLTDSPAYQRWVSDGGHRFGVRGKTYNEVQSELSRLNRFIDSETSTIRGVHNTLKEMASNTGVKYRDMAELVTKAPRFFELASKVEQYLRNVEDMASAVGYQKIWEVINQYTDEGLIDLENSEGDIDSMVESLSKALAEYDEPLHDRTLINKYPLEWYKIKD